MRTTTRWPHLITGLAICPSSAGERIADAIERVASVGLEAHGPGKGFGGLRYRQLRVTLRGTF